MAGTESRPRLVRVERSEAIAHVFLARPERLVASDPDRSVDRHLAEEGGTQPIAFAARAAVVEDLGPLAAVRA